MKRMKSKNSYIYVCMLCLAMFLCFQNTKAELREIQILGTEAEAMEKAILSEETLFGEETEETGEEGQVVEEIPVVLSPFQRGNQLFLAKKYEQANRVFKTDLGNIKSLFGAATTARFLGRYPEAIQSYTQVLSMSAGMAEAYLGRAISYRNSFQYEQAIADFKQYLSLTQAEAGYIGLGDSYMAMKRYPEAQAILSQGSAKYPSSSLLKQMLSQAYLKSK